MNVELLYEKSLFHMLLFQNPYVLQTYPVHGVYSSEFINSFKYSIDNRYSCHFSHVLILIFCRNNEQTILVQVFNDNTPTNF